METIGSDPSRQTAAAALHAVADAQRAVRDRPWPLWLYPTNALLLSGLSLAGLLSSSALAASVMVILASVLASLNYKAGLAIGTPFAIPSNRGFRALVALSGAFVIASLLTRAQNLEIFTIACAVGTAIAYAFASVIHYRSTR